MNILGGKKIIHTGVVDVAGGILLPLQLKGAEIIHIPLIKIIPSPDTDEKQSVFSNLGIYTLIVFTSKNGVKHFFEFAAKTNTLKLIKPDIKFAVVGQSTAKELEKYGHKPELISSRGNVESLTQELAENYLKSHDNVLLCLGNLAPATLETGLKGIANVERLNIYHTIANNEKADNLREQISKNNYDLIIFTSPSGVENFVNICSGMAINCDLRAAAIGNTTAKAMKSNNINPIITASMPDKDVFTSEIETYLLTQNK